MLFRLSFCFTNPAILKISHVRLMARMKDLQHLKHTKICELEPLGCKESHFTNLGVSLPPFPSVAVFSFSLLISSLSRRCKREGYLIQ